jgi:hypothetical protein
MTACRFKGVYRATALSSVMEDRIKLDSLNQPIPYSPPSPSYRIQLRSNGKMMYKKAKIGCTMDVDTSLNAQGKWYVHSDTLFMNFPTYFLDSWFTYTISKKKDSLFSTNENQSTYYQRE